MSVRVYSERVKQKSEDDLAAMRTWSPENHHVSTADRVLLVA